MIMDAFARRCPHTGKNYPLTVTMAGTHSRLAAQQHLLQQQKQQQHQQQAGKAGRVCNRSNVVEINGAFRAKARFHDHALEVRLEGERDV